MFGGYRTVLTRQQGAGRQIPISGPRINVTQWNDTDGRFQHPITGPILLNVVNDATYLARKTEDDPSITEDITLRIRVWEVVAYIGQHMIDAGFWVSVIRQTAHILTGTGPQPPLHAQGTGRRHPDICALPQAVGSDRLHRGGPHAACPRQGQRPFPGGPPGHGGILHWPQRKCQVGMSKHDLTHSQSHPLGHTYGRFDRHTHQTNLAVEQAIVINRSVRIHDGKFSALNTEILLPPPDAATVQAYHLGGGDYISHVVSFSSTQQWMGAASLTHVFRRASRVWVVTSVP